MKTVCLFLALFICTAEATERVNMTCKFDAVAVGYVSKIYSVDLVKNGATFYNSDGSLGNSMNKALYAKNSYGSSLSVYDGRDFHTLAMDDQNFETTSTWSINTGEVTCVMRRGWFQEYYTENKNTVHDTIYVIKRGPCIQSKIDTVYVSTVDTVFIDKIELKADTLVRTVHDTVVKLVRDSVLDTSKATQRFSLRGKYVGLAADDSNREFYTHFLKYNDTVFNENGDYVDSFDIKILYTTGAYCKTIKLERNTLLRLIGQPTLYPTRRGNFYITTERGWNESSENDWSRARPSASMQKEVDRLKSELDKK